MEVADSAKVNAEEALQRVCATEENQRESYSLMNSTTLHKNTAVI